MTTEPRVPRHRWTDPLDAVWLATARQLGLEVVRHPGAYASTDGRGVLTIGTRETLDPDDSLAQMILHECCHWLVEGEGAEIQPDWGLDNTTPRDEPREKACLRLQAHLAGRHGLRRVLAPTTDFRAFYDALPADALEPRHDPTVAPAIHALRRADEEMRWTPLHDALAATGDVLRRSAEALATLEAPARGASDDEALPLAWLDVGEALDVHPHGRPRAGVAGRTCGTCAWRAVTPATPRRKASSACLQAESARVDPDWPACERWEADLDCRTCGACCRAAYDAVIVGPRDPVVRLHAELVVRSPKLVQIRREGDRCAALGGGSSPDGAFAPYTCSIYDERPRVCREFERGGENCLTARRRVGLSV